MSTSQELGFPVKGSLERHPFPQLMREVTQSEATGSLYLLNGQTKKVVFFDKGQPVFVRSNVLSECLGQILAEVGLITQEQCDQTLEAIRRTGKKQGELLVEMGILSEGNLRYGLEAQLRTKLFDIFSWDDGRYQFKPGGAKQAFRIRLDATAEGVIVEAIQDRYTEDRARTALAPVADKFAAAVSDGDGLDLLPEELYFVRCLDGSRSVTEVIDDPPEPRVPTPAALLHGLIQAGAVALVEERQEPTTRGPAPTVGGTAVADDQVDPGFEASTSITEYEDTPLPGELPSAPNPMGDDDFDEDDIEPPTGFNRSATEIQALVDAEPDAAEETFEDDIELLEDDAIELMDEEFDEPEPEPEPEPAPAAAAPTKLDTPAATSAEDDLLGLDDLDDIDLDGAEGDDEVAADSGDREMEAAMRFNEGERALAEGDYEHAVALLELAYDGGFDVAELHAHLAYGRFMAAEDEPGIGEHALELLAYAEEINPNLDIVHAYRGAVLRSTGDPANARLSLERALEINPYCELAMQVMDQLG